MKKLVRFFIVLISFAVILHFMEIIDLREILKIMKELNLSSETQTTRKEKAEKIDTFFASFNAPVTGYGMEFVLASERYDLDWRLLPAICRQESCGGLYPYNNDPENIFGYKIKKDIRSIKEAIHLSAKSISGNGRNTHLLYKGKSLREKLLVYSGREPGYPDKIFFFMDQIHEY